VLALMVLFVTRLVNHAAIVVTQGNKHMETESHVRPLFDRLALDIAQMVKRTDVSYYLKNQFQTAGALMDNGNKGPNDWLAFYTGVPGYYNDNDTTIGRYNSRYSVVAYRVNTDTTSASFAKVERMAKGLFLNGAYSSSVGFNDVTPLMFLAPAPGQPYTNPDSYNTTIDNYWPAATRPSPDPNYYCCDTCSVCKDSYQKYELIDPQVFRFEYYYMTSAATPALVSYPTGSFKDPTLNWHDPNYINIKDVAAIVVAVAAIDPQSRKLLTDDQMRTILIPKLSDYTPSILNYGKAGALLAEWQNTLQNDAQIKALPLPARQGIRLYERYFYLTQ